MKLSVVVCALGAVSMVAGCSSHAPTAGEQTAHRLVATTQRSVAYNYLMYWPRPVQKAAKNERWPLVVFLHGAGERGDDVTKVALHGPPKQAAAGKEFPFILVSPQCPADSWWDVDTLQAMLDQVLEKHGENIDRDRIYVTGLSMGGGGSWEWISRDPNPFAAAAIVCGAASRVPIRIKDPVPVWAFHGEADNVVPPWITTVIVEQFRQAGGETRVSMYAGVNHGSWDRAYDEPELWEWMLSHRKQPRTEGRAAFVMPQAPTTQPVK